MKHRNSQEGSTLILGLGLMVALVIPLVGILTFAARSTTASVTANGLAAISANAAATRAFDPIATNNQSQPQLYQPESDPALRASIEVSQAVQSAWDNSSAGESTGGTLAMETPSTPGEQGDNNLVMGIINLPATPADNYSAVQSLATASSGSSGCRSSDGYLKDTSGNILCWVDHKATNADDTPALRNPTGGSDSARQQWDHYTSGTETLLKLDMGMPWPFNNTTPIVSYFPGVATFSQGCQADSLGPTNCYQ